MKYEFIKNTKTRHVSELIVPKYVAIYKAMFYRFVPLETEIEVTQVNVSIGDTKFELSVRKFHPDAHLDILMCEKGFEEISADDFFEVINNELPKLNVLDYAIKELK